MDPSELQQLITHGESESLEFKKSTGMLREGIETICAFANHCGGYLIFGVDDDGTVIGQLVSDDTLKNIANAIKLNTDPKLFPTIATTEITGRQCVLVTVEESPLKPHLAYGRSYMRVGTTNQRLDRDRYEHLMQQRYNGYGFDHQIASNASIDDIDANTLENILERANKVREINENLFLDPEILLQKLDLSRGSGITNAALLLFAKDPSRFFLGHYEIKCGVFTDDAGYDQLSNDQEYSGPLIDVFHATVSFILGALNKEARKETLERREAYEFPVSVIREAVVNMIVHRDYRQGIKGTVEVRPSTVLFANPAQLFEPTITIERLHKHHPSRPGNKLIARIFYLAGLFENWGGGTLKIISDTIAYGKPPPKFSYEDGMFKLTLFRTVPISDSIHNE